MAKAELSQAHPASRLWPWDLLFIAAILSYSLLACKGILMISANGAVLDSDLQTYAQGMAGEALRQLFVADPVLASSSSANSIPNLERILASFLAPPGEWAAGLLRAGAVAIFLFYAGWYCLGRWLFRSPALAALLAVFSGITVWVGWGTFWGVNHSDPVPRVFFAAIMPFLLLIGLAAIRKPGLRPLAMLLAGLAIWIHGVSALNCGAMLFVSFLFLRPERMSPGRHLLGLLLCLAAFFTPVLVFLWPSLIQSRSLDASELAIFQELFNLRWQEDYSNFGMRLRRFFSLANQGWPVLAGGLAGWLVVILKGAGREMLAARVAPLYLLALAATTAFCWLESRYAPELGRIPMGHELVRGLRFCIPLAWIFAVAGIGLLTGKNLRRLILLCVVILCCAISRDRQTAAAEYALAQITGIRLPLVAEARELALEAQKTRALYEKIREIVPEGEAIYCPEDAMQIRYISTRPLSHSFKDGYAHYYDKDEAKSANWLKIEKASREDGYIAAWLLSEAPWLLCRASADRASLGRYGKIALDQDGWLLIRKDASATRQ